MCKTLLPNDDEFNFRKSHYKCVLDVLDSDICCAICNSDLKKDIILNEDIMIHEIFLCLCCEKCFEKLSNLSNGCIFCSQNIKLKTCETCDSDMCERCINNYCSMSKYQKTLKGCLRCSTNALWSHRSQAAAVLKCFSFELDLRLVLSGKDSLDRQNIYEFIISTAKCDDITPCDVYKIRVEYLFYLLKSKIELAFYDYQTILQTKDVKQCIEHFTALCELILKSTCATLLDFKCLFNKEIIESFNKKVVSILRNSPLFQKSENSYNKTWNKSCPNLNSLNYKQNGLLIDQESSNVLTPNSNVSWGKQMIKQYSSNMGKSEAILKNIFCYPLNLTNELTEAGLNNKNVRNIPRQILGELKELEMDDETVHVNTESRTQINFASEESTEIAANQIVHENIEKKIVTINSFCGGSNKNFNNYNPFKGRFVFKMLDDDTIICELIDSKKVVDETIESSSNINSIHESTCSEINLTICDQEDSENKNENKFNEELVYKSSGSSSNINSIHESKWPEINLTTCDQEDSENENENTFNEMMVDETSDETIESSSNINSIHESTCSEINLSICDQENSENKNENTFNEMVVDETSDEAIESSSNINSIHESTWSEINLTICDQEDSENENTFNKVVDDETVHINTKSGTQISFASGQSTGIAANQIMHKNIKKKVITMNSFCGGSTKNFNNNNPFKGRYEFKMLDADSMICELIDSKKLVNETINETNESSSNINSICENTWPEINLIICDQKDVDNENENRINEELVNETVNLSTESSSNINLIRESDWPKIYITRCDQKDVDNENENIINEESVNETVNLSTESSSNINSIIESDWPKIYITRCDQKNVDNENENKLNDESVNETVNVSSESSSNINFIRESEWPKIYVSRYDQKDIDNENENKLSKGLVNNIVTVSTESSSNINLIRESVWPKVYCIRYDQKDVSKPIKINNKRKFQEKPNSVQTCTKNKKFKKTMQHKKNFKSNFKKNTKKRKCQI